MKKYIISAFAGLALMTSCVDLDLNPLSEGSSENWYSTEQEMVFALNALYDQSLWYMEANRLGHTDRSSDDWNQRNKLYEYMSGTIASTMDQVKDPWNYSYKGIARANTILYSLDNASEGMTQEKVLQYAGEAKFFRASFYTYLITIFGDVPFYTDYITLDQAYEMGRTDREVILQQIYKDYDDAAAALPVSYTGVQRVTKGAAYAMKARAALYMSDWKTCADAAQECMKLGVYSLHEDFEEFFHSHTKSSPELIFALYCSNELGICTFGNADLKSFMPRNNSMTSTAQPSWDLFFAFPCTDGKNVEDSPLYDPANPFANRDPRLAATMAEFGKEFLDIIYDPSPSATTTTRVSTGEQIKNNDNILVVEHAAYNGMTLRKHIDEEWLDDKMTDAPIRIIRYADVLLMYAEAKMEMGEIDADLFKAINQVRARAYKCKVEETTKYPAVTETNQAELRRIIRNERRCELAWENRRWFDLVRWRACGTALTTPIYDLNKAHLLENEATGYWIFPKDFRPTMRPDSTMDLSELENYPNYCHVAVTRAFAERQYLYPIPMTDRTICYNLTQNPGY